MKSLTLGLTTESTVFNFPMRPRQVRSAPTQAARIGLVIHMALNTLEHVGTRGDRRMHFEPYQRKVVSNGTSMNSLPMLTRRLQRPPIVRRPEPRHTPGPSCTRGTVSVPIAIPVIRKAAVGCAGGAIGRPAASTVDTVTAAAPAALGITSALSVHDPALPAICIVPDIGAPAPAIFAGGHNAALKKTPTITKLASPIAKATQRTAIICSIVQSTMVPTAGGKRRCANPYVDHPVELCPLSLRHCKPQRRMFGSNPLMTQWAKGAAVALLAFVALGTVSALWSNPFFMRMTPAGGWEVTLLGALAVLSGVYVAMRSPACADRTAGVGGVLGFLGIACPVCNKILLLLFGGELLLTYYEPIRIYVAAAGTAIVALAIVVQWRRTRLPEHPVIGAA